MSNVYLITAYQTLIGRVNPDSTSLFHYSESDVSGILAIYDLMVSFRNMARETMNTKIAAYAITPRDYTFPSNIFKLKFSKSVEEMTPIEYHTRYDKTKGVVNRWETIDDMRKIQDLPYAHKLSVDFIREKMAPHIERAWQQTDRDRDFFRHLVGYAMPTEVVEIGGIDIGSITPNEMFSLIYSNFRVLENLQRRLAMAEGMSEGVSLCAGDHDVVEALYTIKALFSGPVLKELFYD